MAGAIFPKSRGGPGGPLGLPGRGRGAGYQVAQAVVHCHERGVAHRDVKPENVMISSTAGFLMSMANVLMKLSISDGM